MAKQKLPMQSAKFRKDYMAMGAFLLFFAIVFGECSLAVWIPWHLKLESMWATQMAQQEMVNYFDGVRHNARNYSTKLSKPLSDEAALLCHTLDRVAPYLHRYSEMLDTKDCKELSDRFHALGDHVYSLRNKNAKAFSGEIELNTRGYLEKLRGRVVPAPAPKK